MSDERDDLNETRSDRPALRAEPPGHEPGRDVVAVRDVMVPSPIHGRDDLGLPVMVPGKEYRLANGERVVVTNDP